MDLNIHQMKELIDLFENSNLSEISVQQDEFQVTLKKDSMKESKFTSGEVSSRKIANRKSSESGEEGKAEQAQMEAGAEEPTKEKVKDQQEAITSPIVGTFYRSPSPEEPPYVEVGDSIEDGDTVCIVEAMKVMNEVKAQQSGQVAEICVDDGDSVEYGQELFKLVPSDEGS